MPALTARWRIAFALLGAAAAALLVIANTDGATHPAVLTAIAIGAVVGAVVGLFGGSAVRALIEIFIVVLLCVSPAIAQSTPDLSGRWTLIPGRSVPDVRVLGGTISGSGLPTSLVITQDRERLVVRESGGAAFGVTTRTFFWGTTTKSDDIKASWDSTKLVIHHERSTETRYLDADGNLVVQYATPLPDGWLTAVRTAVYKKNKKPTVGR